MTLGSKIREGLTEKVKFTEVRAQATGPPGVEALQRARLARRTACQACQGNREQQGAEWGCLEWR